MKKITLWLLLVGVFSTTSNAASLDRGEKNESANPVIQLFNGHNLDGWYVFLRDREVNNDPLEVFTVENGILRISGEEWGCITTENEYANYKITLEYKWGELTHAPREKSARDSGLLLHSVGKNGAFDKAWMYSIECNIIEGGMGDFIVVGDGTEDFSLTTTAISEKWNGAYPYCPAGDTVTINSGRIDRIGRDPAWRDEIGFHGEKEYENPHGQWNKLECLVLGEEIYVFLNGSFVNRALHVKPSKGKIQIQSEAAELFFRRIELMPLAQ